MFDFFKKKKKKETRLPSTISEEAPAVVSDPTSFTPKEPPQIPVEQPEEAPRFTVGFPGEPNPPTFEPEPVVSLAGIPARPFPPEEERSEDDLPTLTGRPIRPVNSDGSKPYFAQDFIPTQTEGFGWNIPPQDPQLDVPPVMGTPAIEPPVNRDGSRPYFAQDFIPTATGSEVPPHLRKQVEEAAGLTLPSLSPTGAQPPESISQDDVATVTGAPRDSFVPLDQDDVPTQLLYPEDFIRVDR